MTDRLSPIIPHLSPREDKPSKTTRAIRIGCTLAAILFFVSYELRFYYITNIARPAYMSTLKELEGTYTYSCDPYNAQGFTLSPHPVFLPVITIFWNPFSVSMPLQPPDGSIMPNWRPLDNFSRAPEHGYFYYESDKQIKLGSGYGQLTLIPIIWNKGNFLVRSEDVETLCQESVPNCYYARRIIRLKGEPTYLDGTPLCQQ